MSWELMQRCQCVRKCVCCSCLDSPDQDRDTYLVNTNVHFIAMIRPIEDKLE